MNKPIPALIDDSDWQVPSHEVALFGEKRRAYALVIPVINEGERIRGQLERIKAADLPVDVVVADGGSSDGSLDAEFVQSVGVRAVLTKTGPGKLSAQLRMAYAWCLKHGYTGIVTVDGNGKDGVEAVAEMVAKLDDGCDYVQGSRYLPGGVAENTPLERTIANRLVHAPLLSLAGRRWFGDTTNGFRAYSSRYLLHPEVQPFRDEFQVYGLLFYLTARAGQLGLKVDQVPVARRYPDSGKVPTKIGGLASKLALLGETVFAATGGHHPNHAARRHTSLAWPLLIAVMVALPLLLSVIVTPPYSPDSWAFYELAQSVFGDFYRFEHFRSYSSTSPYSSSFPPLWPSLIAVTDAIAGTGARTGLYLAFAFFIAFAVLSEQIGRRATGAAWVGLSAALILLLGPKMLFVEMASGRTIPLQLFLYALLLLGLQNGARIGAGLALGIGAVAGLAVLNRFDAVLLPLFTAALVWWQTRKPGHALLALVGSVAAISPWIFYSLVTFSTVFATDNSGVATTLDPAAFVTDWWPSPQPGIADDPQAWLMRVAANIGRFAYTVASLFASPLGLVFVVMIAPVAALQWLSSRRPGAGSDWAANVQEHSIIASFALVMAALLAPQILTGYLEYRYFTALFWAGFLLIAALVVGYGSNTHQRMVFGRMLFVPAIGAVGLFSALEIAQAQTGAAPPWSRFDAPLDVIALQDCVEADSAARILVVGDDTFAARAGALGDLHTMLEPRNMSDGRLGAAGAAAFIEEWQVRYVLVKDPAREQWALDTFDLASVPGCEQSLYQIKR